MLKKINWPIFISTFLLSILGIVTIFSSSAQLGTQQIIFILLGLIIYFLLSHFDYRDLKNVKNYLYVISLVLLFLVFILGTETRGVIRWIPFFGFNIQPSEFVKPVLIIFLADFLYRNKSDWINIFKSLVLILPMFLLVFIQPDLGTTFTILAIWVGMVFASNIEFKKLIILFLITIMSIPLTWVVLQDYQKQRIFTFISSSKDPLGVGYNLIQSTIAIGSGQLLGRGLGQGTQSRLQFLPEFRTDFIFASITEELGFLGALLIIVLYFIIFSYLVSRAAKCTNGFGFLIIIGVLTMLFFQTVVNIGMNIGLVPITGITLPLISYGGSSIFATFISLGIVASVIRFTKKIDNE